ncbi:MAG: hypothetical protein ACRBCI_11570 [Cellvibrionaceae bacterium]
MSDFIAAISWAPKIGDPSFMGWFTVFTYFCAFIISLKVCSISKYIFARKRQRQVQLWYVITGLMFFLCINKQLDLQSLFTDVFREIFRATGLYEKRKEYQELFIIGILIAGILVSLAIFIELYQVIRKHLLAVIGIIFLMVFIFIRAASFHDVDSIIGYRFFGIKMNWVLELSGIALILINGITLIKRKEKIRRKKKRYQRPKEEA